MTQKEDQIQIVKNLLQIGAYLQKSGNRLTREFGLTQQQFVVLDEIVTRGPINQTQLVGALLLEKSNVSKIVKKLIAAELIEVSVSADDARATVLRPSQKGKVIREAGLRRLNQWNLNWLAPLSQTQITRSAAVLARLKRLIHQDP